MFTQRSGRQFPVCGLYYNIPCFRGTQQAHLPQVDVRAHASILAITSRTVLKQVFVNPSATRGIKEVRYAFPLYDGVSVVGFSCQVGNRTIVGEVKEKEKAKEVFRDAVARGETAGLFEQLPEASDVFITTIGNIPPGARIVVNVTYLGELKHDMEVDGIRFTIPTSICPRYGSVSGVHSDSLHQTDGTLSVTVDAEMAEGSFIQKLQSPTHPISMSMGTTSVDPDAAPAMNKASATLTLGTTHLDTDFVLQIIAKDTGIPKAILEAHPTIPNHRALLATLVPKFTLPAEKPEIVFVCDQSGSMMGSPMKFAIDALQVFLKSLPIGVKFNICSFGSKHTFLWPRSATYGQDTLNQAVRHASRLKADYGGTDILGPLRGTIENRYTDMPLDIILLTDGEIWDQQLVFDYLNGQIQEHKAPIRVFTLGIGNGVSHALIEGIAKAGNGFSQTVGECEKMGTKVVRMLKGALSPHVNDHTLEVKYSASDKEDDFEIVEKVADSLKVKLNLKDEDDLPSYTKEKKPISLFDTSADLDEPQPPAYDSSGEERYAHLVSIPAPKILQAPQDIPPLFAFNRTTVYLLLGPDAPRATPTSVILRGTSAHGPLELEIPIQVLDKPGETIHQLAAKKATSELEQGRGWLASARDADGQLLKTRFDGRFNDMVEREAVRLGVQFQVGGKWCSFVATETSKDSASEEEEWEYLDDETFSAPDMASLGFDVDEARSVHTQQVAQAQQQAGQQAQQQAQKGTIPSRSNPLMSRVSSAFGGGRGGSRSGGLFQRRISGGAGANTLNQQYPDAAMQQQQQDFGRNGSSRSMFGSSTPSPNTPLPAARSASLFGGAPPQASAAPASPTALQDYQMQIMKLEQQNKNRLFMATQTPPSGATQVQKPQRALPGNTNPPTAQSANANDGSSALFGAAPAPFTFLFSHLPIAPRTLFLPPQTPSLPPSNSPTTTPPPAAPSTRPRTSPPQKKALHLPSESTQEVPAQEPFLPTSPSYSPTSPSYTPAPPSPTQTSHSEPASLLLTTLIAHQSFNGSFAYSARLLGLLNVSVAAFGTCCAGLDGVAGGREGDGFVRDGDSVSTDIIFTVLVIVFIETQLGAFAGEWELVVAKAREWVEAVWGVERAAGVGRGVQGLVGRLVGWGFSGMRWTW